MRRYENLQYGNEKIILNSLDTLADKTTSVEEYRNAFERLGIELGRILAQKVGDVQAEERMVVCASEDDDWLAQGVENGFGQGVLPGSTFWSTPITLYQSDNCDKITISHLKKQK